MRNILTFLLLIVLSCTVQFSWAVIAYPGLVDYKQPDGTFVRVRMMGDEFFHWAESEDGYTLLDDNKGFMTLALRDKDGNLQASEYRMMNINERTKELQNVLISLKTHESFSLSQLSPILQETRRARALRKDVRNVNSVSGQRQNLVILVDFPDRPFTKTQNDFYDLMNKVHDPIINPSITKEVFVLT